MSNDIAMGRTATTGWLVIATGGDERQKERGG